MKNSGNLSLCVRICCDIVWTSGDDLWDKGNTSVPYTQHVYGQVGVLSWQQRPSGANVHPAACNRSHFSLSWLWSAALTIFFFPGAVKYTKSRCRQYTQSLAATSFFSPLSWTYTIENHSTPHLVYLNLSDPSSRTIFYANSHKLLAWAALASLSAILTQSPSVSLAVPHV